MKLNVLERVILPNILPTESNYVTYKIVNDLKLQLAFTEEEFVKFEIKTENKTINWSKSEDKEIEIGVKCKEIIREALTKLDEQGKINNQNSSLYEKFLIN